MTDAAKNPHDADDFYLEKARDYLDLHEQVETSNNLLETLESFLSTFQKDLSEVSGQISFLQTRSKEFETRLKGRKKIERPLTQLLLDLCIPPELAILILDTKVDESWVPAIRHFEERMDAIQQRTRVKAAKDLGEVAEGLRIVAATKLRFFFLNLFQPIRATVATNIQIVQTSVLLKFRTLLGFLQRRASPVAREVQRAYVGAARAYYETAFRRYTRSLGYVLARDPPRSELIGVISSDGPKDEQEYNMSRLDCAQIEGAAVTLAYMADDKTYKQPLEAIYRSMLLVLMDNATAEYAFITAFFNDTSAVSVVEGSRSPRSPLQETFNDGGSVAGSILMRSTNRSAPSEDQQAASSKEIRDTLDTIWKQVFETALQYCKTLAISFWEPVHPPVIPLLTMMRLNENVLAEVQHRSCGPLESFIVELRLAMWPIFQKEMDAQVESLKKLVSGAAGSLLSRSTIKESVVDKVSRRYATLFSAFLSLSEPSEEAMLFANLGRLRPEVAQIVVANANKIKDERQQAAYLSTAYENLLRSLVGGTVSAAHPKAQAEVAFWREKEEAARRRITVRPT